VLESISRDIGVAAGGTKQTLRGYGFTGTSGVTFNAVAATSVVVVSDNVVTCVTPAGSASETAVDVVITNSAGSSTLSAAFEYAPAPVNTYAAETFASGSFGAFTAVGTASIVAVPWARGGATKAAKFTGGSPSTAESSIQLAVANNPALNRPNGLWRSVYLAADDATVALVTTSGQIKTTLNRNPGQSVGFIMGGYGPEFNPGASVIATDDQGGGTRMLGSYAGGPFGTGFWTQEMLQMTRNSGASTGRVRRWINGKLVMVYTSATLGDNLTTQTYDPRNGIVYTQNTPAGSLTMYAADPWVADGYLEDLE
jgi:hypothetical protein